MDSSPWAKEPMLEGFEEFCVGQEGEAVQVATESTSKQRPLVRRRRTGAPMSRPATTIGVPSADLIELRRSRRRTGAAFEVLLGVAACLSLVAVVQRATEVDVPSPEGPPPALFVQVD